MTERSYADIAGSFRRGAAGARAARGDYDGAAAYVADDPELADTYARQGERQYQRQRRDEQENYARSYADRYASGDYAGAGTIAAKQGDLEGVTAARTGQSEHTERERLEGWRILNEYGAQLDQLSESEDPASGYAEWIARARQEAQASPELAAEVGRWPDTYDPAIARRLSGVIRTWRDRLVTPQQLMEMEATNRRLDIQDRQADISERRASAAERTAEAAMRRAENAGSGGSTQEFSRANSLRDEYNAQTQNYRTIADFADRSERYLQRANAGQPSGQGDVGLVYALAKIYDPTSVVREGEFAMVARQGGYGEQMRSWVETAMGRGLSPAVRGQIMTEIRNGVRSAQGQRDQTRTRYTQLAQRAGIDPALVIDDYQPASAPMSAGGGGGQLPPPAQRQAGQRYPMPDGGSAEWDGQRFINPQRPGG